MGAYGQIPILTEHSFLPRERVVTMTVLHSGSTGNYSDNWEVAFGKAKKRATPKKKAASKKLSTAKKSTKKKTAAKAAPAKKTAKKRTTKKS